MMTMKIQLIWKSCLFLLLLSAYCFLPASSLAQITFERTYGDSGYDEGWSARETSDGGYIITGGTGSFGAGGFDVYLVKTDSLGDTLWTRTYGDTANDWGYSVQETSDGGYILSGSTESYGSGLFDLYLIKTDNIGDTLWTKVYGGTGYEIGYSVQETSDGGYIIAGYTGSFGAGGEDVYLVKTDSLGDTLWTKTYGGSLYEGCQSVRITSDGGFIIVAWTNSFGAGRDDIYLIKTDPVGDTLWTRLYGDSLDEWGYSAEETSDGGFILAGYTATFGAGGGDVYLIRTDSLGNTLWSKTYGDTAQDISYSVEQTSDGGFIVTGFTKSFGAGEEDVYLIKTDASGDSLWTRTYGGTIRDKGRSVHQTSDGGYIIGGSRFTFGVTDDFYLVKTDGNGQQVGIEEKSEYRTPNIEFRIFQNQPNPFHNSTSIRYQIPTSYPASRIPHHVSLNIYDITGRLVETLVDEMQEPGSYKVEWDSRIGVSPVASGVYFYRIQIGEFTSVKKLVHLR
jgi:hypothetical protein